MEMFFQKLFQLTACGATVFLVASQSMMYALSPISQLNIVALDRLMVLSICGISALTVGSVVDLYNYIRHLIHLRSLIKAQSFLKHFPNIQKQ